MMKHEFDELTGITTAPEAYERIEFVYMNSEKFQTKQQIADFYKEHDMNGIEKEYKEVIEKLHNDEEFKTFVSNVAYFAKDLNCRIKQHLADNLYNYFKDKTIVKMFAEYKKRDEAETQEEINNFFWSIKGQTPLWDNHCLTNAAHYRTVIEDFTYSQWWHEQSEKERKSHGKM